MKRFLMLLCLTLCVFSFMETKTVVYADELKDELQKQINLIDLTELEDIFNENNFGSLRDSINRFINGNYSSDYNNVLGMIKDGIIYKLKSLIPYLLSFFTFSLIFVLAKSFLSNSESNVIEIISFILELIILILISTKLISVFKKVIEIERKLVNLNEIVSPLLITMMLISGGTVSASVFTPSTVIISGFINTVILKLLIPSLIILFIVIIVSSNKSLLNTKKIEDFFNSVFKWVLGIFSILFTTVFAISGISSGVHDGIKIKATKYFLTNSIPIINGIVGVGFDFVLASGVIIKNAIGLNVIFLIISIVLNPIIEIVVLSWVFKLITVFIQPLSDLRIENFCSSASKILSYLSVLLVISALIIIIFIFLTVISANAFI